MIVMVNHMTTAMTEGQALLARVREHFARGGSVMVKSYTRPTIYTPRHAAMFHSRDRGVQIGWPGRSSVYVTPEMIAFSILK